MSFIAVIGWLSFSCVEAVAQTPNSQGMSTESPAVKEQAPIEIPNSDTAAEKFSVPVTILETQEQKASREAAAKDISDHDAKDLEAQRKAADAAERGAIAAEWQVTPARVQMILAAVGALVGAIGLGALIYSLCLNRAAIRSAVIGNKLAIRAIRQEQANAQKGLRAYIGVVSIHFDCPSASIIGYKPSQIIAGQKITDFVVLTIRNFGQTPANKVYTWVNWYVAPYPESLPLDFSYPDTVTQLPPGVEIALIETSLFPTQEYVAKVAMTDVSPVILSNNRQAFLYVYGRIAYTDLVGVQQTTNFCFMHSPNNLKDQQMERYGNHNYAT